MFVVQPNTTWLDKYPWWWYSRIRDELFCGACFLLLPTDERKDKGLLVNVPFPNFFVLQSVYVLKCSINNPASRIDVMVVMVSSDLQSRIAKNKYNYCLTNCVCRVFFLLSKAWHLAAMWKIFVLRKIQVIF